MAFFDRFRKQPGQGAGPESPAQTPEAPGEGRLATEDLDAARPLSESASDAAPQASGASSAAAATPTGARFVSVPEERFNLDDTTRLAELYQVPREQRGLEWLQRFQGAVWNASLVMPAQPVFLGPDGMPYARLELPPIGQQVETNCLSNIFVSLAVQGLGAAFFQNATDTPEQAQYVCTTGVLESLRAFGAWDGDPQDAAEMQAREQNGQRPPAEGERQVLVGAPTEDYLPKHTARLLFRHLSEGWKVQEPRVALVVDQEMTPTRNLVIGYKFSQFPDAETASRATQMLLWYLPPRRHLLLLPENWTVEQLRPLRDFC